MVGGAGSGLGKNTRQDRELRGHRLQPAGPGRAARQSAQLFTLGVRHKSSLHSPSHAFRTFCNDVRAPTASQIGARGEMRELESTAASRARGVPVLAAPLHNACPGASRNAAIPSLVLAQQMRAAQQGQHQRCTACTAQHRLSGRARACGIASSMCIQTLCDLEE